MSAKNELRTNVAYVLLIVGVLLLLSSQFAGTGWRLFTMPMGALLLFFGVIMLASVSIINGVPWFVRLISRHAEPVWDGEVIHTDGGEHKIRYDFDEHGRTWFVASDVCVAIGTKSPAKGAMRWGGVPLLLRGENACFSEENVQAYLTLLATHSHAASRLLVNIRNDVLRRLERQRDENKRYS